ncbi:hypothetical protein ACXR2U_23245 [Jatrophihabitans sp. YIM 134969]
MHQRTARGNRLGLLVLGILLLAGGVALFGAHQGWYGAGGPDTAVYPDSAASFVDDNSGWLWPVAAAVAIIVGLVFLRWLLVQPRTDSVRRLIADSDDGGDGSDGAGRTTLTSGAVADAVEADVETVRGVRRSNATLTGPRDAPSLWLSVTTAADADLGRLRQHLDTQTLPAVRAALEQPDLPVQITVAVSNREAGREVN